MINSANDISIVTPTYKRSDNIKAIKLFGDKLIISCHEFEAELYKEKYPDNNFLILPDNARGNMAKVRNYIYHNSPTKYLVMIDDDVEEIGYHQDLKLNKMKLSQILDFMVNGFVMCEELKTVLWGVNLQDDPQLYRQFSPFSFLSAVLGPFCCHIIDNKLSYDERLGLNEDYDFSLQVLQKYHRILRFNKYYYRAGHLTAKGGCGAYRILDEEKRQSEIMIKKWGSSVVKYDFSKSTNPRIKAPYSGV